MHLKHPAEQEYPARISCHRTNPNLQPNPIKREKALSDTPIWKIQRESKKIKRRAGRAERPDRAPDILNNPS